MSSPEPIPPPNDRRSSRASSAGMDTADGILPVGGPPNDPSPLQIRASNSLNSKNRRSTIAKQPPDLHLLEYVSQPDSNLVCLICHSPFDRPVQLFCGHFFCRECLDHAWCAQQEGRKTCPTCRSRVDPEKDVRPVPKIIETMLDELVVKCPNAKSGCGWVEQRVNVNDHVMLYCEYTLVECAQHDCRLHISQKEFHKGCLHYTVSCEDCHTSMMKKDLEDHQRTACANRSTNCLHCDASLLRLDLKTHIKDACGKVITPCQGTIVGCTFTAERAQTNLHEKSCPMATMAPHFRDQQARIERNEARLEPLTRKVGILEDGLSSITNMLYPANDSASTFPVTNPWIPTSPTPSPSNLVPTPTSASRPPRSHPYPKTHRSPFTNPSHPFDSQVHHLLTLHESLRDEVNRIANALTDLEGRTNMMVMNESQRTKDDMLHTNAAINGMRHQLHWLISATLQQRNSTRTAANAASGSTSGARQGGSAARQGPSAGFHAPLRRLSDSTRQDTKL
ncbi:uncharacterized protein N0V89_004939 [Didymosphaeria variabile]|uniref:TRAF-type zinc finger protein n=1 Tax=Didymosphaeria variabile TaxID=1932322 RepID=A0A9W9CAR0_9PLEO|nr:uncharacterized protein N0V89_004939 [Didymosphaeria variabile]KAJ4353212.1 hypothetical protein N0V89_004939 [Didymosphaeria variabile]